ncbi:MAG: RNA 3'-terminal phosphate cyclase [Nitrososphaerales archaeon]
MEFVEIDGSQGEGGGQILRTAMTLATISETPIRISRIRAGRREPGLRPQHLQAVMIAAKLSRGKLKGASVGSTLLEYSPGTELQPLRDRVDVGTAGSLPLIAQTIIPISIFRDQELDLNMVGGTEVPNSPTIDYLQQLVIPIYEMLGADVKLQIFQRGYYPRGGGKLSLQCSKTQSTGPLIFPEPRENIETKVLSVSRSLPDHVSRRQADAAKKILVKAGFSAVNASLDFAGESLSPGSSVLIYSSTPSRQIGASALGERGKPAEKVGEEAATQFVNETVSFPNVDSHLADMLITLLCCVPGKSVFRVSMISDHFRSNATVAKSLTGCKIEFQKE